MWSVGWQLWLSGVRVQAAGCLHLVADLPVTSPKPQCWQCWGFLRSELCETRSPSSISWHQAQTGLPLENLPADDLWHADPRFPSSLVPNGDEKTQGSTVFYSSGATDQSAAITLPAWSRTPTGFPLGHLSPYISETVTLTKKKKKWFWIILMGHLSWNFHLMYRASKKCIYALTYTCTHSLTCGIGVSYKGLPRNVISTVFPS